MIKFGIRQSFDRIEQIKDRYFNINVPVEVALPYYWDIYEPIRNHLVEIAEKIQSYGTKVLSIHAVQAPITDEKFKIWGKEIADFAKTLGVKNITLHPNNVNNNIHLSARESNKQHLPIDDFCKDVTSYLIDNKWNGNELKHNQDRTNFSNAGCFFNFKMSLNLNRIIFKPLSYFL